jgi:hypothetical protein
MSPYEQFCNRARRIWCFHSPFMKIVAGAVHITCAQTQRRLDDDKVQSSQTRQPLNEFAPAATNGGA